MSGWGIHMIVQVYHLRAGSSMDSVPRCWFSDCQYRQRIRAFVADTDPSGGVSPVPGSANGCKARKERRFRSPNEKMRLPSWDGRRIAILLDINLAGQILPLVAAEDLSVGTSILLRFLETDGKFEVQLMPPQF